MLPKTVPASLPARSIRTCSPRHVATEIRIDGDTELRKYGVTEIRNYGLTELRKYGTAEFRIDGTTEIRSYGGTELRIPLPYPKGHKKRQPRQMIVAVFCYQAAVHFIPLSTSNSPSIHFIFLQFSQFDKMILQPSDIILLSLYRPLIPISFLIFLIRMPWRFRIHTLNKSFFQH